MDELQVKRVQELESMMIALRNEYVELSKRQAEIKRELSDLGIEAYEIEFCDRAVTADELRVVK